MENLNNFGLPDPHEFITLELLYLACNRVVSLVFNLQIKVNKGVGRCAFVIVKSQDDVLAQPHFIGDLPVLLTGRNTQLLWLQTF